jgi:hypothetical protein
VCAAPHETLRTRSGGAGERSAAATAAASTFEKSSP